VISELRVKYGWTNKTIDKIILKVIGKPRINAVPKRVRGQMVHSSVIYDRLKEDKKKHMYKLNQRVEQYDSDIVSISWPFYKNILKKAGMSDLIKKYNMDDRVADQKYLKELSDYAFKSGPKMKGWEYCVGIDQLYGYNYDPVLSEVEGKIEDWVKKIAKPAIKGDSEKFLDYFKQGVEKLFFWKDGTLEQDISIEQFCTQPTMTGTSGSAFDPGGKRAEIEVGGEKVSVTNNKYSKSIALSPEEKIKRISSTADPLAKVSIKVEVAPKVRLIVSADYNSFMKEKYIDTWMSRWMHGNKESTLWQTKNQALLMWEQFSMPQGLHVPIDQSAFDHNVSKLMLNIVFEQMAKLIKSRCPNPDELLTVIENIIEGHDHTYVVYDNIETVDGKEVVAGTKKMKWENGVISGRYLTAFLDTVCNIAEKNACIKMMEEEHGETIVFNQFNAQGDDQLCTFADVTTGFLYWAGLSSMGFNIHIRKNFFSKIHNEYLRKYATKDGMNGYPARMINSILWIYPGQIFEDSKFARVAGLKDKWLKLCERARIKFSSILGLFLDDAQGYKVDKQYAKQYLSMRTINGGPQLVEPLNNFEVEKRGGEWRKKVVIDDEGFTKFNELYGEDQTSELRQWALKVMQPKNVAKYTEEVVESLVEGDDIESRSFNISTEVEMTLPALIKGWSPKSVMGTSRTFIEKVFPGAERLVERSNAPRTWVYDLITGRVKIPTPKMRGISEEMASLIFSRYSNSLLTAMLSKRTRKGEKNKWKSLSQYVVDNFEKETTIRSKLPKEFY
jgi:hypothetical protein